MSSTLPPSSPSSRQSASPSRSCWARFFLDVTLYVVVFVLQVTYLISWSRSSRDANAAHSSAVALPSSLSLSRHSPLLRGVSDIQETVAVEKKPTAAVAYAWPMTDCDNDAWMDVAMVLRHSIHETSSMHDMDYQLYALLTPKAQDCAGSFFTDVMGMEVLPVDSSSATLAAWQVLQLNQHRVVVYLSNPKSVVVQPFPDLIDTLLEDDKAEESSKVDVFYSRRKDVTTEPDFLVARPNPSIYKELKKTHEVDWIHHHYGEAAVALDACRYSNADSPACNSVLDGISWLQFTADDSCPKPWECKGESDTTTRDDMEPCLAWVQTWHEVRADLEERLSSTRDKGPYQRDIFRGHCQSERQYIPLNREYQNKWSSVYNQEGFLADIYV